MKAYAVFQALRYVFLVLTLIYLVSASAGAARLSLIFTFAELLLALVLTPYSLRYARPSFTKDVIPLGREHLSFGFKAALGNLLTLANTRTDVMILGLFAPHNVVGIYSSGDR